MSKETIDARQHDCPIPMMLLQKAMRKKGVSSIEFFMAQVHKQAELEGFLNEKGYEYSVVSTDEYLKVDINMHVD